jgi:RNA polymerase sigma-70 factor (ECF subfamily)
LALAAACAAGDEAAWDRFVREFRPILYRAADALDPHGRAREIADSLYADLYGLKERGGERQSLFRYYQGRSSLATWLRAVLAQRWIDRVRADRRIDPLPDDVEPAMMAAAPNVDRARHAERFERALDGAVAALDPRDRLRLRCYYAREMKLAAIGRLLGESEATASRHLARIRRTLRQEVEERLRADGLGDAEITTCFAAVVDDAGSIDLDRMLDDRRKKTEADRSI